MTAEEAQPAPDRHPASGHLGGGHLDPAAKAAGENFPVALRVLPRRYRRHLTAVYRFARLVDDVGDEGPRGGPSGGQSGGPRGGPSGGQSGGPTGRPNGGGSGGQDDKTERLSALGSLDDDVKRIEDGTDSPRHPVIRDLAPTVRECAIPLQPFRDLIQANRQDQAITRYQTYAELLGYCELSANPVGRIVLHIFGSATPERLASSDRVCSALQLAEHWQDVAEDFGRGRVYLPVEDIARFGCSEDDLAAAAAAPRLRALMAFETERAARLLDDGASLVGTLHGYARLAVAGYVAGGRAALAAIAAAGHDVLAGPPRAGKGRVAAGLARTYLAGR